MITLAKITYENARKVVDLQLAPHQRTLVDSNAQSLAEAYCSLKQDKIPCVPLAIAHEGEAVGFLMYEYYVPTPEKPEEALQKEPYYYLYRLMVDASQQGKGYGRAAMERLIEHVRTAPEGKGTALYICYLPDNLVAKAFYESLGFVETGQVVDGEVFTRLEL